jgi:hypothetical protein
VWSTSTTVLPHLLAAAMSNEGLDHSRRSRRKLEWLIISCEKCGRRGRYNVTRLVEREGSSEERAPLRPPVRPMPCWAPGQAPTAKTRLCADGAPSSLPDIHSTHFHAVDGTAPACFRRAVPKSLARRSLHPHVERPSPFKGRPNPGLGMTVMHQRS